MSYQNVDTVLAAYEHLNRGEVDALIALCDDEFEMDMSERVFNPDTYRGSRELRRFYDDVRSAWQSYHWEVEQTRTAGDAVVAMLHCHGQGRGGGPSVDWRVAWLWRFRDGRPVSLRFYRERPSALKAVGLEE
jgi:ketosteroid isomerase-like protein